MTASAPNPAPADSRPPAARAGHAERLHALVDAYAWRVQRTAEQRQHLTVGALVRMEADEHEARAALDAALATLVADADALASCVREALNVLHNAPSDAPDMRVPRHYVDRALEQLTHRSLAALPQGGTP